MFPRISETFILEEIQALRRHGVPVKIYSMLAPTRDARVHPEAKALMPEVEILPEPGWSQAPRLLADLWACGRARPTGTTKQVLRLLREPGGRSFRRLARAAALAVRMRRDHIAHLHAAWAHGPSSVARIASRLTGIPWSMGAHAKDIHLSRPSSLAKKLASARFAVTCSAANQELLRGLVPPRPAGSPEAEIALLHHGVNGGYFTPAPVGAERRPPLILSVGRLVPKKGFESLLEAVHFLRRRGFAFRLEIVGDGSERGRLEKLIEERELGEVVRLRGLLLQNEVREALQRATCFALACRTTEDGDRDGIPNTLAEAMACGLPVVSTRLPGIEELVRDGETGLLVPPDDPRALADALARLLAEPALRRTLGTRARTWVSGAFDARDAGERRARRFARALGVERVLYVSADRGVPVRGDKGASVHVRSMLKALGDLGVETTILTARGGPGDGPRVPGALVEAISGKTWKQLARRLAAWTRGGEALERALLRLLDNAPLYREGGRVAEMWRPDLIYERYALTSFAGAWLARYLRVPLVLEVNSPLVDEEATFRGLRLGWLARRMERWLARRADLVVVVSAALREHVLGLGVDRERILLLPNAVDPSLFHPGRDGSVVRRGFQLEEHFVAGFCGSLKPWHGVHGLLDATARASRALPGLRLLIVGDGPERGSLEARAKALGIADRVRFAGTIPHDRVPEHLAACDVLVAPYDPMNGFYFSPLKLAEYLAAGRPVVASAVPGLPDSLGSDSSVVWVAPGDADALGDALVACAAAPRPPAPVMSTHPVAWTWTDVARRVLAAGEQARRGLWRWSGPADPRAESIR